MLVFLFYSSDTKLNTRYEFDTTWVVRGIEHKTFSFSVFDLFFFLKTYFTKRAQNINADLINLKGVRYIMCNKMTRLV